MWNIARSAEAMFSRWAMKRLCKFVLKKKLGKFILGDIDLNHLDVQLSAGTIQLSDLALNVDYLNQKFASTTAIVMKEGSIGSLLITMPWKGDGCSVEVDELELVFAPSSCHVSVNDSGACTSNQETQDHVYHVGHDSPHLDHDTAENTGRSASLDVHEGVKAIANMVKWLLTNFHVKIRKLIVAFDPCFATEKDKDLSRTLVLRLAEIECGTCISETASSDYEMMAGNLLGLSRMTNFVKFQGAVLEFLHINGIGERGGFSGTTVDERPSFSYQNVTVPIITGDRGGFSGNLKLCIPWTNGSLDIHKVEADVCIDPLQLKFQPKSIRSIIYLWEIFKDVGDKNRNNVCKGTESDHFDVQLNCGLSNADSCRFAEEVIPRHKYFSAEYLPLIEEEPVTEALLSESNLISDWLRSQKDEIEEPDFGACVDQFYECFDGLRNSQSALGSSGVWNWTCSVFSVITAASSLASGSLHIPSDQLRVETNLRATISAISIAFFFTDEEDKCGSSSEVHRMSTQPFVHYMSAHLNDLLLELQVRSNEMNFEAKVKHFKLVDCISSGDHMFNYGEDIKKNQDAVQNAIPHSWSSKNDEQNNHTGASGDVSSLLDYRCTHPQTSRGPNDVVQIELLKTIGDIQCQIRIDSSGDSIIGPMSFSLKLPYFIFWVNIDLINEIFELLKQIGASFERPSVIPPYEGHRLSPKVEEAKNSVTQENLTGNVFIPNARIILCFPFGKGGCLRGYSSWDHFIALDLSSSTSTRKISDPMNKTSVSCSENKFSLKTSRSLHFNFGGLNIYLITLACEENADSSFGAKRKQRFLSENIMSISCGTKPSVVSLFWQESPAVASGDVMKKAKLLASSDINGSRDRFKGKDYEFAAVSTVKDSEDFDGIQQKMIEASGFLIHAQLYPVTATLSKSQYVCIHHLLSQLIDCLSQMASDHVDTKETSSPSKTSALIECESLTISISVEVVESIKGSFQYELPGCWNNLRLEVQRFGFFSGSNVGGISNSSFLRITHGDGNLWGHISGAAREEVLISCNNASMGRGDGDGSNVLFSKRSGSDIIHFVDPQTLSNYTSITVRCGTIVAVGGRLDWLDKITSFFSLSSPETEQCDTSSQKKDCEESLPYECSFVLNLVDIGLSYEPCLMFNKDSGLVDEQHVACLLAASSLRLSNTSSAGSAVRDYKISLRDLGLLLSVACQPKSVDNIYSVEHLRKIGYVKVAQEANIEALLRINCENGTLWELECSESHIFLNTCHDTTAGLIRLATQLQQLFAPDIEESVVHLQTRWDNVQQANGSKESCTFEGDSSSSSSTVLTSIADVECKASIINLMDEICEDAFQVERVDYAQADSRESPIHASLNDSCVGEACYYGNSEAQCFLENFPLVESSPSAGLENSDSSFSEEKFPEFIEDYLMTDLCPLSELSLKGSLPNDSVKCRTSYTKIDQRESSGWYDENSFRILEDHVSEPSGQTDSLQYVECDASSTQSESDECGKVKGRIVFSNVNVVWRLYSGSDWKNFEKTVQRSSGACGRDATSCLELILSGLDFKYDIYPDGGIHVSRLSVAIQDFFLNDCSNDAPWKLVLGYYQSKDCRRKSSSKAFRLSLQAVRPEPSIPLEEYRLRIALLPIRLHLHQSQLDFLISCFGGTNSTSQGASQSLHESRTFSKQKTMIGGHVISTEALLPYFQKFDIWPMLVRVDYSPCRVDLAALRGGKYVELVNLVPWKGVEMNLKHVQAVGVYGWGSVCETIIGEWLEDISQNQIHKLLKGLPPIRSLVAVGSGAAKLVSLPVKSYKKDQKLLKGMQRGTIAFLRSISLEAIGLGVHLAAGAHEILLQAEYILTSIPPSMPLPAQNRGDSVRSNQPVDARQGIQQACDSISVGFSKSASALVRTPLKRYQRGAGVGSALMTAVKAAPAAAIAPASATARALHCALVGVRNSLDPGHKKESLDKYRGKSPPQHFM